MARDPHLPTPVLAAASEAAAEALQWNVGALHVGAHIVNSLLDRGLIILVEPEIFDTPVPQAEWTEDALHQWLGEAEQ